MIFIFVEKGATLKKESSKIRSQTFAKNACGVICCAILCLRRYLLRDINGY